MIFLVHLSITFFHDFSRPSFQPSVTYPYVIQSGLMTDDEYPYESGTTGSNGTCAYVQAQATGRIKKMAFATPPCWNGTCPDQNDLLLAQNLYENGPTGIIVG